MVCLKRILITGTSGFVGGELLAALGKDKRYELHAVERYVTGRRPLGAGTSVPTHIADLTDATAVKNVVRLVQPDAVVHLAAISPVSYSYDHAAEVIRNNVLSTVNLSEACRRELSTFDRFIFSGTSEEYGNNGALKQYEGAPRHPNSPYAVSKVACEDFLTHLWRAYEFPAIIARPFNTYGRRNDAHFFIERMLWQMKAGQSIVRLGDSATIRDFMFIDDHVKAYKTLLESDPVASFGQVFNFCTGVGRQLVDIAEIAAHISKWQGEIVWNTIPRRPEDIEILIGDNLKAKQLLGWTPQWTLEDGLRETLERMQ